MNLFEKAFEGKYSVLARRIDPDNGLWSQLRDHGVLTQEQISACQVLVCYF